MSTVLLRFVSFLIIIRYLSKEEFGTWVLFLTVTSIFEVVRNGFIKNALIKFLASNQASDGTNIQTASLLLNFIITSLGLTTILLLSNYFGTLWESPILPLMFLTYSISSFLLVFYSHIEFVATASLCFKQILFVNITRYSTFLFLIIGTVLLNNSLDLVMLVIYLAISILLGLILATILLKPQISLASNVKRKWVMSLSHFGKYVVGTNLSGMIFRSTDQILIGSLLSTNAVASYNTALRLNNFIDAPIMGISNVFYSKSSKDGESSFTQNYTRSVSQILCLLLPLLLVIYLLADVIILVIAGANYSSSVPILKLTMLYTLFIPFSRQFGTLMDSIGKPKINLVTTLITSILNIGLSYLMIHEYGVIGAAYGTLTTYLLNFLFVQTYLYQNFKFSLILIIKEMILNYKKALVLLLNKLPSK